jgi:DNA repair photolyase
VASLFSQLGVKVVETKFLLLGEEGNKYNHVLKRMKEAGVTPLPYNEHDIQKVFSGMSDVAVRYGMQIFSCCVSQEQNLPGWTHDSGCLSAERLTQAAQKKFSADWDRLPRTNRASRLGCQCSRYFDLSNIKGHKKCGSQDAACIYCTACSKVFGETVKKKLSQEIEAFKKGERDDYYAHLLADVKKTKLKSIQPKKASLRTVIFHDNPSIALTKQTKIDSHNFPFTLNTGIGCHFGCRYCYLQGYPFNRHAEFPVETKVKLWIADRLDKELQKYKHLPQHLKRVQVNVAAEGYLPLAMAKVKKVLNRDIMSEVLQVFRKHWESGNHWMVHLITKSHMVLKHLDIISAMRDQVQLELTITTLDEDRRRKMEGLAPSVSKRLKVINKFSSAGVFVRAMCMPLIGNRQDAETIRAACFDNGARAFKHKGVNYWDEQALLYGETTKTSGRHDDVFEDLLVNSCEPYRVDGEIQKKTVKMPAIVTSGKTKRWKGYQDADLEDREMTMEVSGYSDINDIDWGYVK